MKITITRTALLFVTVMLCTIMAYSQTIRYVDSNSGRTANTAAFVYATIQAAHDASAANDIIYVIGSPNEYVSIIVTKPLHFIGPGYLLPNNPQTQANSFPANISVSTNVFLQFASGSSGSIIEGIRVSRLQISTSNITIRRNNITNTLLLDPSVSGILIQQNFVNAIGVGTSNTNIQIANNLINTGVSVNGAGAVNINFINNTIIGGGIVCNQTTNVMTISNNIIFAGVALSGTATVSNNIFPSGTIVNNSGSSISGSNNIANTGITFPTGITGVNANVINAVLFSTAAPVGTIDNNWLLAAGSPAIGAGTAGTDIGFTGGITPYVLSGMPAVPSVYNFQSPASGTTTLPNVQVQIRSNN